MVEKTTFLKHLSFSMLLPFIRFSYGFMLASFLSKNLIVSEYGEWSLFISILGFVLSFSSLNLMYSSQVIFPSKKNELLLVDLNNIVIIQVLLPLLSGTLFIFYFNDKIFSGDFFIIFIIVLFFRTFCYMIFGLLRALLKVKEQVSFLFIESVLILVFIFITLKYIENSVISAILAFLIAEIISTIYGFILLKDYFKFVKFDFKVIKPYLSIGIPLIPFAFMDLIINATTPLFIKLYSSVDMVAFYSIAQKVAMIITIPSSILNNIYTQYLSKAFAKSKPEMLNILKKFFVLYFISVFIMFAFLYFFGEFIITFISSKEYTSSYNIMILLLIANIFVIFSSIFTSVFAVMKKTKKVSFIWVIVLLMYIVLSLILSKNYGLYGAIYAILISFGIGFLSIVYFTIKELKR